MKLKMVVPRAGADVLGGAELHGVGLAERLAARGHDVEVVTTTATHHGTWESALPEGEDCLRGLPVRRFKAQPPERRFAAFEWRARWAEDMPVAEEHYWFTNKGYSPGLVEYLADATYDAALFIPYLSGTALFGTAAAGDRAVLIPALHDENYARLRTVARMLRSVRGILFSTPTEVGLARRLAGDLAPWAIAGYGFDEPPPVAAVDVERFIASYELERPLVLYSGRWEAGKGVPELLRYHRAYRRRGGVATLALTGSGPDGPRRDGGGVRRLGVIDAAAVPVAMAAADVLVQPSLNESLSLVMLEAWLQGTPVIVSGRCAPTRWHVSRAGGGLWFGGFPEYEAAVTRLAGDPDLARGMGAAGRAYVLRTYGWQPVLDRIEAALADWFS